MPAEKYVYKLRKFECATCGAKIETLRWDYEPAPTCACGTQMTPAWYLSAKSACVIDDSIPGGRMIEHGLCNEDGSPRRFDSKAEIRRVAKEKGFESWVEHVPERGSDRSPHTTRWI